MSVSSDALVPRWVQDDLASAEQSGLRRHRQTVELRRPGHVTIAGREYVDFSSNDYLGLAGDRRIARVVAEYLQSHAWGAAASPLMTGYHEPHARLEGALADFFGTPALLFGSGYAANLGVLAALVGPGDVVFCEKRNHASLIDGCRLSGARLRVYRSNELDALERRLEQAPAARRRLIVTDSVFSMDGDKAPLRELCEIAERTGAILYVDEAHAVGVLGPNGRGLGEELAVERRIHLRMGTLGKALGGAGAFAIGPAEWIEWLIQRARSYIYSTAAPPAAAVAALEGLAIVSREPERRARLCALAERLRAGLKSLRFDVGASDTPIVPVMVGSTAAALKLAERLRAAGCWVTAIRPPTVPAGSERLRLSLSAAHETEDIDRLLTVMEEVRSIPADPAPRP